MVTLLEQDDTRVEGGGVKVKKRKKHKKRLFKLAAMNLLVDENSFLKGKYDKLSAGAEEKLGYHWNEVVQNILFNKYVKPQKDLMNRYLEIKRRSEANTEKEKKAVHPKSDNDTEAKADVPTVQAPADGVPNDVVPPAPSPNDPVDTRITTESTDTITAGDYQYSGPLMTAKGGMNAWMHQWAAKMKHDKSGMTIIQPNRNQHNMGQNAFKKLNESGNPLANPALLNTLFEEFENEFNGNQEAHSLHDTFIIDSDGKIISSVDSKSPHFYAQVAELLKANAECKPQVVKADQLNVDPNDETNWLQTNNTADSKVGDNEMFEDENLGTNDDLAQLSREKGAIAMDRVFNKPEDRQRDADFEKLHKKEPILAQDAKHLTHDVGVNEMDSMGANASYVGPLQHFKGKAKEVQLYENPDLNSMNEGDAKPAALVQLERLHKETEKASNGYYKKEQKERNLDMKETPNGGSVQQHDYDSDSMKHKDVPMHHTDAEEAKYVMLNRGGNLADRAIQGIKNMPDSFLARMKDEAGETAIKNAQEKKAEIDKLKPALAPPDRVKIVKESVEHIAEGVVLTARYITPSKRSVIAFNTNRAEKINETNSKLTLLETKGFGNDSTPGAKEIITENNFFIDLGTNTIYMLEKKSDMLNESVQVSKAEYERSLKLLYYNPSTRSSDKRK